MLQHWHMTHRCYHNASALVSSCSGIWMFGSHLHKDTLLKFRPWMFHSVSGLKVWSPHLGPLGGVGTHRSCPWTTWWDSGLLLRPFASWSSSRLLSSDWELTDTCSKSSSFKVSGFSSHMEITGNIFNNGELVTIFLPCLSTEKNRCLFNFQELLWYESC